MTPDGPSLPLFSMDAQRSRFSLHLGCSQAVASRSFFFFFFFTSLIKSHCRAFGRVLAGYPLLGSPQTLPA